MGILTLGVSVYVTACIIYATLSLAYFFLSQHKAFSCDSSCQKRVFFGLAGGGISLCFLLGNAILPQTALGGFAALPVILTTILGGWLSGLIALIITLASHGVALSDKFAIGLVFLILFAGKIWRKRPIIIALAIVFVILACRLGSMLLLDPTRFYTNIRLVYPQMVYPLMECLCFFITYFALVVKKEYVEASISMKDFAMIDSVTSLNNRKRIDQEIIKLSSETQSFGVGLIDLDDFKQVNDRYGHLIGDRLLFETAEIFRSTTRSRDFIGRYGGEEFLIFVRNADPLTVYQVCQRIRAAVANTLFLANSPQPFKLTVSIGVGMYHAGDDLMTCIHQADIALYQAKRRGKNTVVMANGAHRFNTVQFWED
ncbi:MULTISPECIES: GGDEF domain-containing protein [Sodalis]|jgi:diguanylate cyclase|uniref:diguanylate cyclase n=2 Tax=Sodalis ligni TaxID=2697027 RepID=A0A4R1N9U1_9GAMM|nr:diguanylate cyclase [Sodalis ligni]TCL03457.1 diguanylate cyclase [Sodalis ligni]